SPCCYGRGFPILQGRRLEGLPHLQLALDAADHLVGVLGGAGLPAEVRCAHAAVDRLKDGLIDGTAGRLGFFVFYVAQQRATGEDHRHGVSDVLALQTGGGAVRGLGDHRLHAELVVEAQYGGLRTGDGAEHLEYEVAQRIAVAVERRDNERLTCRLQQQRIGSVDKLRVIRHVGVAGRGGVKLFLEDALVDRADGELRPAKDLRVVAACMAEGKLGNGAARPAGEVARAVRDLVQTLTLAPLLRVVGVLHRHAHNGDWRVDTGDGPHMRDAPPGAQNDLRPYHLAQQGVGAADIAGRFGRDGRRLDAEAGFSNAVGRLAHDLVLRGAAVLKRKVIPLEAEITAGNRRVEHAQGFLKQLLPGLVPFHNNNRVAHSRVYLLPVVIKLIRCAEHRLVAHVA